MLRRKYAPRRQPHDASTSDDDSRYHKQNGHIVFRHGALLHMTPLLLWTSTEALAMIRMIEASTSLMRATFST